MNNKVNNAGPLRLVHKSYFLKSALTVIVLVASAALNAQMKSGYRFGINLTTIDFRTNRVCYNLKTPMGVHFGGYYDISLNKHLSIQTGFVFSSKGADYKIDTVDLLLTPTYIEIPVNLALNFGSKTIKISLFAGPYSACAIGGYEIISGNKFKYLSFGRDVNDDLKHFDLGFNFGIGINVRNFLITTQVGLGFTDVSPCNDLIMKNKVIGISMIRVKG
jgi:hypothetical protein